jgi:hypothetical protein
MFLLVEQTRRLVASGILQLRFALTLPGQAKRLNRISANVAEIQP